MHTIQIGLRVASHLNHQQAYQSLPDLLTCGDNEVLRLLRQMLDLSLTAAFEVYVKWLQLRGGESKERTSLFKSVQYKVGISS